MCIYRFELQSKNFNNFFNHKFNENFASTILKHVFGYSLCNHGNDLNEPDLLFDGKEWFEIALICDSKKRNNLVQRIINGQFKSEDVEIDLLCMMQERIKDKSTKKYVNIHPNLCLICPVPMIEWIAPISNIDMLFYSTKQKFFDNLYSEYVERGLFNDIYIIVPNIDASWTLIDLKGKRACFKGKQDDINYPYYIIV